MFAIEKIDFVFYRKYGQAEVRQLIFSPKEENKLTELSIINIRPNKSQPRKVFAEQELASLAHSIANNGILQPLTVRRISQTDYELVAGERRLRAAIMAGFKRVPCIVMRCSDRQSAVFALLENLQRTDLNMFEEALAIKNLIIDCNLTQERVAKQLGKKQSTIANKLRLLRLEDEEQSLILKHGLSERHARVLIKLTGKQRRYALDKIIESALNVSQTESLVETILQDEYSEKHQVHKKLIIKDVRIFINTLTKAFDTMKLSGIDAVSTKNEDDEYIEYIVKIPKTSVYKQVGDISA